MKNPVVQSPSGIGTSVARILDRCKNEEFKDWGMQQYFLHKNLPDLFDEGLMLNALNFVLGNRPGENTSTFVSGVGSRSVIEIYGVNRADRSFIPGVVVSGTGISSY